jgi:hypothetical protein
LGVPDDLALLNLIDNPRKHQFHDTRLSRLVAHARHALSIDELRGSFTPTLWSNEAAHPDMTQIWFPGDHSDVGGGHAETGLSDGALKWMMDEAEKLGIAFRDVKADIKPNPRDVIHGEITGLFKALKTQPRGVPRLDKAIADKAFHASSVDRQKNPPLTGDAYWPTAAIAKGKSETRAIFAREHWNRTGIFLEAKVKYRFTATGQWLDASVKSGPQGTKDGNFQLAEVVHVAASAIGGLENVFRRMTGNKSADFWLTRREEKIPWFALVGVVANGIPADEDVPHETFEIGAGKDFTPKRGGYLYCYANDAWHAYENNRGSVQLTVERL